jgi:diadenosine tetraphosphatase ApaH/serine/threonine PP2A family protein phosphatase
MDTTATLGSVRVAVLSDIHSNAPALEAVMAAIDTPEQLWVLGDTVGYGPDPDGVVSLLRARGAVAVQGNHDAAALGRISSQEFNSMARAAVEWTASVISRPAAEWLAGLPDRRVEGDFTLVHGSPRDPLWEYLFSVASAQRNLAAFETRHCLVGHTHVPLVFREEAHDTEVLAPADGARLQLDERRCILNPGSVGQPRDGDPRASVMLLDTATGEVEWRRVPYPVERTQAAIRAARLPGGLADRLALGL